MLMTLLPDGYWLEVIPEETSSVLQEQKRISRGEKYASLLQKNPEESSGKD